MPKHLRCPALLLPLVLGCAHPNEAPAWVSAKASEADATLRAAGVSPLWKQSSSVREAYRVVYDYGHGPAYVAWLVLHQDGVYVSARAASQQWAADAGIRAGSHRLTQEAWDRLSVYLEGEDFWQAATPTDPPTCIHEVDGEVWLFEGYRAPDRYAAFYRACPGPYLSGLDAYLRLLSRSED